MPVLAAASRDYTYCDLKRAVQSRLHAAKTLATYRALLATNVPNGRC